MSMGQAVSSCFKKYAVFSGRARRSEYWNFVLFNILMAIAVAIVCALLNGLADLDINNRSISIIIDIYSWIIWLPGYAVLVRRAHDIGKPGVLVFISMVLTAGTTIGDFFSILTFLE